MSFTAELRPASWAGRSTDRGTTAAEVAIDRDESRSARCRDGTLGAPGWLSRTAVPSWSSTTAVTGHAVRGRIPIAAVSGHLMPPLARGERHGACSGRTLPAGEADGLAVRHAGQGPGCPTAVPCSGARSVLGVGARVMRPRLPEHEVAEVLGATSVFSALDRSSLLGLAAASRQRTYGRGQYLWYQGDPGDHLVVVGEGLVKVVLTSERGDEVVLVTLGPTETVGELAILDGSPRSASVVAVEPTTVVMLPRAAVLEAMASHPAVLDAVLRLLGQLVRRLTEQTGGLVFLDLAGRVAKVLLQLAQRHARDEQHTVLDVGLSQSDIAAMVGATRPAVNRILQLFASRGLISVDGRVIVLRDPAALRRRAGL